MPEIAARTASFVTGPNLAFPLSPKSVPFVIVSIVLWAWPPRGRRRARRVDLNTLIRMLP